jgi:hypothetical protein
LQTLREIKFVVCGFISPLATRSLFAVFGLRLEVGSFSSRALREIEFLVRGFVSPLVTRSLFGV